VVFVIECDVTRSELLGASSVIASMAGVFAYAQEVVERHGAHVADGSYLGGGGFRSKFDQVFDEAYGDGKLVLGGWVLSSVPFDLSFELEPIFALATVGRVGPSVHLESLSDGT